MSFNISVITPSLNASPYIDKAIQSVLDQQYEYVEHIVIDGGSIDGTIDVLKKHNHLKWISEPDEGQANAMNKGFKMSSGDIIMYLNADDYFLPGAFQSVIAWFKKGNPVVVGNVKVIMSDNNHWVNVPEVKHKKMLKHWAPNAYCVNPVGYSYLREVQEEVRGFNEENHFTLDLEFLLAASKKFKFKKINKILGVYRFLPGTKTANSREISDYWSKKRFFFIDTYLKDFSRFYIRRFEKKRQKAYRMRNLQSLEIDR